MITSQRVPHVGDKPQYERTDPDYIDKRDAALCHDVKSCPPEWLSCMLAGLSKAQIQMLEDRGVIERAKR